MPTTYTAAFTIPSTTTGGRLSGGFGPTPTLQEGDSLVVTVAYPAANGPALTGYLAFSSAPNASNQTTGSAFLLANANAMCLVAANQQSAVTSGSQTLYTFQAIQYAGGLPGRYELTVVICNGALQWSEDPEFDTSN